MNSSNSNINSHENSSDSLMENSNEMNTEYLSQPSNHFERIQDEVIEIIDGSVELEDVFRKQKLSLLDEKKILTHEKERLEWSKEAFKNDILIFFQEYKKSQISVEK